jgi:hypothetical protein
LVCIDTRTGHIVAPATRTKQGTAAPRAAPARCVTHVGAPPARHGMEARHDVQRGGAARAARAPARHARRSHHHPHTRRAAHSGPPLRQARGRDFRTS